MIRSITSILLGFLFSFSVMGSLDSSNFNTLYRELSQKNYESLEGVDLSVLFVKAARAKKLEICNILLDLGVDPQRPVEMNKGHAWEYPLFLIKDIEYQYLAFEDGELVKKTVLFKDALAKPMRKYPITDTTKWLMNAIASAHDWHTGCKEYRDAIESWLDKNGNGFRARFVKFSDSKVPLLQRGLWLFPLDIAVIMGNDKIVKRMLTKQRAPFHVVTLYPFSHLAQPIGITPRNLNLILLGMASDPAERIMRENINALFHKAHGVKSYRSEYPNHPQEHPFLWSFAAFTNNLIFTKEQFEKSLSSILRPTRIEAFRLGNMH